MLTGTHINWRFVNSPAIIYFFQSFARYDVFTSTSHSLHFTNAFIAKQLRELPVYILLKFLQISKVKPSLLFLLVLDIADENYDKCVYNIFFSCVSAHAALFFYFLYANIKKNHVDLFPSSLSCQIGQIWTVH